MTEKRFTQKDEDDWEILDRNNHFAYAHSGYQASKIITELNELVDTNRELYRENKELKKINGLLDDSRMEALSDLGAVIDENEQLKQFKEKSLHEVYDLNKENEQLKSDVNQCKILIDDLKRQNQKLKGRLNDLGVEYYD